MPDGETALEGARRELLEETGVTAADWRELARIHLSNSVSDELAVLFLATGLTHGVGDPRRDRGARGPLAAVRRGPGDDARRPDHRRDDGRCRGAAGAPAGTDLGGRTASIASVQDTRRDWDAIVVGLGAIGSAAAYWLSRTLGDRVLGLERFELDHGNGASADHSRIIRLSYHRPDYVRLARRAYETWAAVESEADERIVTVTGGLDLWPPDPAIPMADYTASLEAEDVPFERLDADEVRRRWPHWRLDDGTSAIFQADGGLADPFRATPPTAGWPGRTARRSATGRR